MLLFTRTRITKFFAVIFVMAGFLLSQNIALAAVAHDTASESHTTGSTGSTSQASFTWSHTPAGIPRGVLVFIYTDSATKLVTGVTYGGVTMSDITAAAASDTNGEPGRVDTFFLGSSIPTGAQSIIVSRANNATKMYASAMTQTALVNTEVYTAGIVLLQESGTAPEQSVTDGSAGTNSLRYAGLYSGLNTTPTSAGANSTFLNGIDLGGNGAVTARETTAGQGARSVGFAASTDDRAAVHLAVREIPATGSVSASPTTCTISSGASTCSVPFTWSISNAVSPNLYNSTTATQYSTSASGTGVSYAITNGSNTVQARNSTTVLASTAVTASCISGTSWSGSSCVPTNTSPTLSISQPDGVSDSVTVGSSYNITYTLSDAEQVVTSAFYYDTDAVGLNGTAISGACATAVEGSGVTCSWNTTGVTPGSYYVYGLTSDGIAPQVSAYSSGTITISAVPAVPTVTTPTATSISTSGATLGANVTSLGSPASISARGTCWATTASPVTNCTAEGGTTTGVFTHARTGMNPNIFYYYRGYATNSTGTGYSTDGTFTTSNITGTISASPSTCTILSGASTCTVPFTWSITNATSPNLYNSTTANQYSTAASGTGVSYAITNGSNTVQVRDSSTVLNSTTATGSCDTGTSWNGSSCTVVVVNYDIVASSGANGSVTPSGTTAVAQGGSQVYSIAPDSGYAVATLVVDSVSVATSTTYTFSDVQATHTISATFSLLPATHTITSSVGSSGGSISPLGATTVADGASQTFTISADSGFVIETLTVDSVSIATSTSHTFTNVTAEHTISATFALIPAPPGSFTIVATSGTNGTVSPNGSTIVTEGGSQAYTITANGGYEIATLIIDSFTVATSTTHTFTNVTADHTIEATFTPIPTASTASTPRRRVSIVFTGKAFPGGKISIIQKDLNTQSISESKDITGEDGSFQIRFDDLMDGMRSFGLLIKDPEGRTAQTKFFLIDAVRGDEIFKNIVTPPTIDILSGQVSRGSNVKVFGYASPSHTIRIYLNGILNKEVLAGRGGVYSFDIPTGALDFGQYKVQAKQINLDGGKESDFSTTRTFVVSKLAVVKADFSGDGKIDIKDWSIFLARFFSKDSEIRKSIDLTGDGKADISDFSIFIKTLRKK